MPQNAADFRRQRLKKYHRDTLLVLLLWSVMVAGFFAWNDRDNRDHAVEMATDRARTILSRDLAIRRWVTTHGGIYVPANDRTPPNPQLSHLPERDITTPSGRRLTLMNPAYMLRQLAAESSDATVSTHLASLKPMRQENTPDSWEAAALRSFERGAEEVVEVQHGVRGDVVRLMLPFHVDHPNCLVCHGSTGYRLGDVRGGISVSVSLVPYLAMERQLRKEMAVSHVALWLLGVGAILAISWWNRRTLVQQLDAQEQALESRSFLEEVINGIQDLVIVIDRDYRVVLSNWHNVPGGESYRKGPPPLCHVCLHNRPHPCDNCHLARVFAGETVTVEKTETHDGRGREITAYPYRDTGGRITMAIEIVRDVQERRKMEASLRASEEQFRHLAEQAQDIIYRLRLLPKPVIEYMSPAVTAITGYGPEEWALDTGLFSRLTHSDDLPLVLDVLAGKLPPGNSFTIRISSKRRGLVWLEHRLTPVLDQEGRVEVIDGIARDITSHEEANQRVQGFSREMERRVAKRTEELEQSTRELEEFCYSIAHDLRGPLRSINSNAHLLELECPHAVSTPHCKETLQRIWKSTTHMGTLMDLLLELGRVSRIPLYPESVDLTTVCRRLAAAIQANDPGRDALFTIQEGMTLTADSAMMERLMELLLDNAWKFTSRKAVAAIEVHQNAGSGETVIMVRDNGVGFEMAHAASLFKPFRRLHRLNEFAGAGMGLAIARRIMERHGGRIWGEGEPGAGATIYLAFPCSHHGP